MTDVVSQFTWHWTVAIFCDEQFPDNTFGPGPTANSLTGSEQVFSSVRFLPLYSPLVALLFRVHCRWHCTFHDFLLGVIWSSDWDVWQLLDFAKWRLSFPVFVFACWKKILSVRLQQLAIRVRWRYHSRLYTRAKYPMPTPHSYSAQHFSSFSQAIFFPLCTSHDNLLGSIPLPIITMVIRAAASLIPTSLSTHF